MITSQRCRLCCCTVLTAYHHHIRIIVRTTIGMLTDRLPPNVNSFRRYLVTLEGGSSAERVMAGRTPPLATEKLPENTVMRVGAPQQCFLGAAACYLLFMLTCALLMPSLFQAGMLIEHGGSKASSAIVWRKVILNGGSRIREIHCTF